MSILRFTPVQQREINCINLYLGVTYLSEISTIDGQSLIKGINDGNEEYMQLKNVLAQLVQPKANAQSWVLWDIHLQSYTYTNILDLQALLGACTSDHSTSGCWNAY